MLRAATVRGQTGDRRSRRTATSACCTARSLSCAASDESMPRRATRRRRARRASSFACSTTGTISIAPSSADTPASRSGSGRSCPTRCRRATATTRARTRRSASTARSLTNVNANAKVLTPEYLDEGRGARRRVSSVRHSRLSHGALQRADRDRRTQDGRSARPGRARVVEGEGRRDLRDVPDFGGFLVKANSEGQPGPQDYKRTHADGANMLADAVAPHGGIVMWRAFVYSNDVPTDRVKQAYDEFKPLDGTVPRQRAVQVKNGPLDFQPREPFSSALRRDAEDAADDGVPDHQGIPRPGHASRLSRAALSEEVLDADTWAHGKGSTVAQRDRRVAARLSRAPASRASPTSGTDRNWTGSQFNQANWYAFGRLAWDPTLSLGRDRRRVDSR